MKTKMKKLLCLVFAAVITVSMLAVSGITVAADTPKIYMRYPGGHAKAFTIAIDDGLVGDKPIVELFANNSIKGTFYVCTGRLGTHSAYLTFAAAKELYIGSGMEVASHSSTHADLPTVYDEKGEAGLKAEILDDVNKIKKEFGNEVYGIAYPGAPPYRFSSPEVTNYLKKIGLGYARALNPEDSSPSSERFELPDNWYNWEPTCAFYDDDVMDYTNRFLDKKVFGNPLLFFTWGHSTDLNENTTLSDFSQFCYEIGNRDDIAYMSNGDVYSYVKDYEKLQFSPENDTITNPTKRSLWIACNRKSYEIKAGQTVKGIYSGTYVAPEDQEDTSNEEKEVSSKNSGSNEKNDSSSKKAQSSSKINKTSSNKVENTSKNDKTSSADTENEDELEVIVEEIIEEDDEQGGIMQYLWILIAVGAVVIIALVIVILYPKFKK